MKNYFIADDLSGALDAAAAFHHAGQRVRVLLSAEDWIARDDELIALTTETRNAAPETAAAAVARTLARGCIQGARLRYKKIDSTLRGPIAAELTALARELPGTRLLFCPANPAVGRTIRDGVLYLHGVPVSETEFGRDPVSPVRESNLQRLLGSALGDRVVIADAATEEDLASAVDRMAAGSGEWVAIGSGALARPVAALDARSSRRAPVSPVAPGPTLLLCGSAHPLNRNQAAALQRARGVALHELSLAAPEVATAAVIASLRSPGSASLLVAPGRHDSALVLRTLAAATTKILAATGANRLFVTGGETAFAVCGALGFSALAYAAELEPGLCLACSAPPSRPLLLAIKPGGFGDADTWLRAWDALQTPPR